MLFKCKKCGKEFNANSDFIGFFAEPPQEPALGVCDDCTAAELAEVDKLEIGKDQLEKDQEKETDDCIFDNIKSYCTQNGGDCSTCSLVNYGRDCQNNPIK